MICLNFLVGLLVLASLGAAAASAARPLVPGSQRGGARRRRAKTTKEENNSAGLMMIFNLSNDRLASIDQTPLGGRPTGGLDRLGAHLIPGIELWLPARRPQISQRDLEGPSDVSSLLFQFWFELPVDSRQSTVAGGQLAVLVELLSLLSLSPVGRS